MKHIGSLTKDQYDTFTGIQRPLVENKPVIVDPTKGVDVFEVLSKRLKPEFNNLWENSKFIENGFNDKKSIQHLVDVLKSYTEELEEQIKIDNKEKRKSDNYEMLIKLLPRVLIMLESYDVKKEESFFDKLNDR